MSAHQIQSIREITKSIIARGCVDQSAYSALEKYYHADSIVDQAKADLLFELSSVVANSPNNCQAWQSLFVQSICRYVVFDMNSPGEVAANEADWLRSHMPDDRQLASIEIELIREIQDNATCACNAMKEIFARANLARQALMPKPGEDESE